MRKKFTNQISRPKIIVVCGPTGSGKTDLAVSLCKKFNGEIINADSRQVYKYMDIGTGKELDKTSNFQLASLAGGFPISNEFSIQGVPIHLVNILEPNKRYTVGRFKKDAEKAIGDIISRGKTPFIVGGTGLYIDALTENFQLPIVGADLRVYPKEGENSGSPLQKLVEILEKVDPESLKIVDLKNRRRVERALEYCLTTGKKFSESRKKGERKYEVLKLAPALSLEREKLIEKINQRVDKMIEQGLEKEVRFLAKKYGWESEAMTGIGYKEWKPFFVKSKFQMSKDVENVNGKYFENCKPKVTSKISYNRDIAKELWDISSGLAV